MILRKESLSVSSLLFANKFCLLRMTWNIDTARFANDPCDLGRHLGIKQQPRQILKSLPDVQYLEMANADRCCGLAGQFEFMYYDPSRKSRKRSCRASMLPMPIWL
jgi:hypothetical protein